MASEDDRSAEDVKNSYPSDLDSGTAKNKNAEPDEPELPKLPQFEQEFSWALRRRGV